MTNMSDIDMNMYCSSKTKDGRMCGNHKSEGDKCHIHRVSRCDAITRRGRKCKNNSYAHNKCYSHLPEDLKDEIIRLNDIRDEKRALAQTKKNKKHKDGVMFDLTANKTITVSRYIHKLKRDHKGRYVYDSDKQFAYEYFDFLNLYL